MANNKVQLANGTVLIDITDTTANASDVAQGKYFYTASGVKTEGTSSGGGGNTYSVSMSLNGVTSSTDDTSVLQGNSFYADLVPTTGETIDVVKVMMGGVDVTSQVLTAGTKTKTITANGTYDAATDNASGYSSVIVNVPEPPKPLNLQAYLGYATVTATSYTATNVSITVAKTGIYRISWMAYRNRNANTHGTQIYKNGTAIGTAVTTWLNIYGQNNSLENQSLTKGDVITIYARSSNTSYVTGVGNLIIKEV